MGVIDYSREPRSDIAFFDMKSFYASVECVERGLDPLTTSLCVVSRSDNSKGLILASSPTFKRVYGKKNVGRSYDLPFNIHTRRFNYQVARRQNLPTTPEYIQYIELWARKTLIVPPRMGKYIEVNLQIQEILKNYGTPEEIYPYSIDEGFIDVTKSLNYFSGDSQISRREKLDSLSARIQYDIWRQTGVYSTIGMSNANPLLAKLALDNEAKNTAGMRANWSYEDVETKVWKIKELTDFWGIGKRMEKRLNQMGVYSVYDLAMSNPDDLKREFGVIGVQNWFHSHGVDESNVREKYRPKSKGIGNSQVLPYNYTNQRSIELVLKEMGEQVAIRLRRAKKNTMTVAIHVGYASEVDQKSINAQRSIDPTQNTKTLQQVIVDLFRQNYIGGAVRTIGIRYENLIDESIIYYTLFTDVDKLNRENRLDHTIDQIRQKYGFLSIQKATALTKDSRSIARSKLIGGHSAGGLDGLE